MDSNYKQLKKVRQMRINNQIKKGGASLHFFSSDLIFASRMLVVWISYRLTNRLLHLSN